MAADPRTPPAPQPPAADGVVCPFCAHVRGIREADSACPKCTMEDTVGTRRSTGERIGPWFVLQRKNPTAPGLRFSVLLTLARRGHVTAKSIVRGPTTGQLWRFASEVKGLSRLFGVCWHCKASVSPDAATCPRCKSAQEIPDDPDVFLESHSALPLMRELPANGATPPVDERLPAPRRDREPPARRPGREPGALDDLADLTRALAIHNPTGPDPTRAPRRSPGPALHTAVVGGEPILSASDLATAFQLDAPKAGVFTRGRRAAWRVTKVLVVTLVFLGAIAAAVGMLKPEWRQVAMERSRPYVSRASGWWNDAYALVVGSSAESPAPPTVAQKPEPITTPESPKASPTENGNTNAAVPPTTPIRLDDGTHDAAQAADAHRVAPPLADPTPSVVDATPTRSPADEPTAKVSSEVTSEPKTEPKTETKAESKAETPKQPDPAPVEVTKSDPPPESPKVESPPATGTHELTLDEAIAQANELRNSALDAEARKDWRAAVVIYEQIATLPEAARPSDLKVRLGLARERLAK